MVDDSDSDDARDVATSIATPGDVVFAFGEIDDVTSSEDELDEGGIAPRAAAERSSPAAERSPPPSPRAAAPRAAASPVATAWRRLAAGGATAVLDVLPTLALCGGGATADSRCAIDDMYASAVADADSAAAELTRTPGSPPLPAAPVARGVDAGAGGVVRAAHRRYRVTHARLQQLDEHEAEAERALARRQRLSQLRRAHTREQLRAASDALHRARLPSEPAPPHSADAQRIVAIARVLDRTAPTPTPAATSGEGESPRPTAFL